MSLTATSCGILCFRDQPVRSFLLMKHADRLDLPKGHVEPGESELDCAFREFEEETGLSRHTLILDPSFRFETSYLTRVERNRYQPVEKTVVIFLAELGDQAGEIKVSEHFGYDWYPWNPPHRLQAKTIDPLLQAVEQHWQQEAHHGD